MAKISTSELKAILSSARSSALGAGTSALADERKKALDYFYGDVADDLPSAPGRSSAVSNDVSDTIEGLMPPLMEIFASGDEVVRFEPVAEDDVEKAAQETDYVNHVFLQQNPGFLVLYNFIKDALLSKNGFVKVFWDEHEEEERETYYDQPDDSFAIIAQAAQEGTIEIIEHTAHEMPGYESDPTGQAPVPQLHDVTIVTTKKYECAKVEGVPPEEFGIGRNDRNIRDANYCYHQVFKTEAELVDQGFDKAQIRAIPSYTGVDNSESNARDTVDESQSQKEGDEGINRAARIIKVTEHYIRMDYEQDGKAKLYRVTTGGEQGDVLKRDGKPDIEQVDLIPFASMTPIIVPHRFFGRSVADLVMDIMRIKTALIRGLLDNTYLANNARPEIAESHASENTLDDLLVSRPGAPIRVKQPGGLNWQVVPTIAATIYPALEYLDSMREWRTGVTKQGQGIDADALQNQSATAVNQAFTAAQARMKLIARIMAETGIRDLFALLHATIRKHGSQAQTVRLRNKWVQVDPREWKSRNDLTIHVGLGSGGKAEQLAETQILMGAQEKGVSAGLITPDNLFNTAKRLTKILGEKDVDQFFTAPQGPEAKQPIKPPQDPKLIELQAKNEIEKTQAQADIATQDRKTQAEMAMAREKAALDMQQSRELHQQKMAEHQVALVGKVAAHAMKPAHAGEDGQPVQNQPGHDLGAIMAAIAPKPRGMKIVRDQQGRVSHTEPL